MTRAIYEKAIFHREQQMDRKVYDRARNVLPTDVEQGGQGGEGGEGGEGGNNTQPDVQEDVSNYQTTITLNPATYTQEHHLSDVYGYGVSQVSITYGGQGYLPNHTYNLTLTCDTDEDYYHDYESLATVKASTNANGVIVSLSDLTPGIDGYRYGAEGETLQKTYTVQFYSGYGEPVFDEPAVLSLTLDDFSEFMDMPDEPEEPEE